MAVNDSNKSGQIAQTDFADNVGGLNLSDSVFRIQPTQAVGGYNYDYILTGGIRKRLGPVKVNSVADTQLRTLGLAQYNSGSGLTKVNMRAAGTKLQYVVTDTPVSFTNLTRDNLAASENAFSDDTQVNFIQFNSGESNILWATGGGSTFPVGATSTTKWTINGAAEPTGTLSAASPTGSDGSWSATGTYKYSVALRKSSTLAISNAALTASATISGTTQHVVLTLSGITAFDTTLYDKFVIYRSLVSGAEEFTVGDVVAYVSSSATTYTDLGDNNDVEFDVNVPRAGNIVEDHSVLPTPSSGTYANCVVFKQRLVVSLGNVLYISSNGNSEYWALTDRIVVPSAGKITGLAVISFTAPQANSINEMLVVFKERETLTLTGDSALGQIDGQFGSPWVLLSIDNATGCSGQGMIVSMQGWLAWIDYRGVHIWDGGGKPYYASRLIEPVFQYGGQVDKSSYLLGIGQFFQRENQIIWYLSSNTIGEQKYAIKMDVRLTLLQVQQQFTGRNIDAVFSQDNYAFPVYAANSYIPAQGSTEQMLLGDDAGFVYYASNGNSDAGLATQFSYLTPPLSCGDPNVKKQFHKVIVWVANIGNWDLTLDYWSNYLTNPQLVSTKSAPVSTADQSANSLWDVAIWDASFWDSFNPTNVTPIVFNLGSSSQNNSQGTAVQLQFRNENANEPITIHGFSVFWSVLGGVTA